MAKKGKELDDRPPDGEPGGADPKGGTINPLAVTKPGDTLVIESDGKGDLEAKEVFGDVYVIGRGYKLKLGVSFRNKDGGIAVLLNAIPYDRRLTIQPRKNGTQET